MASPRLYLITVDGTDVTTYVHHLNFQKSHNQPVKYGTIVFSKKLDTIFDVVDEIVSSSITIQRGSVTSTERYIFRGEIVSYKQVGSFYEMRFADKMYGAVKREQDYTYDKNTDTEAGIGSEIVKDLFTISSVPYSSASVPTTGVGDVFTLNLYPAKGQCIENIKDLATTYNRQLFYNDTDDLGYFTPFGNIATTTVLTTGDQIFGRVAWNNTSEDMSNNITIIGGEQLDWNTQTMTAAAAQTVFVLDAKPVDTEIYVNSVKMSRGVNSSDPKDFYVKDEQKEIIFTVAPFPNNPVIGYSYNIPVKVNTRDDASITSYTQRDNTIINSKLTNSDDAELNANNILDEQSSLLVSAPIKVINNNDLDVGQTIQVVDTVNSITRNVEVQSINYYYPFKPDEVMVGKVPIDNIDIQLTILNNIAKLQRQLSTNSDISVQLIPQNQTKVLSGFEKIEIAGMTSNVLYWDSSTQGLWDSYNWSDGTAETYSLSQMYPFNQCLFEDFRSTTLQGTGTASWDTANGRLAMSSSGMHSPIVSEQEIGVFYKSLDANMTSITISADETRWNPTDFIVYYVSTDSGASWQPVTIDALTTLTPGLSASLKVVFIGNGNVDTYITNLTGIFTVA